MTQTTPTRIVEGIELPASGNWAIDPGHTEIAFTGRHLMLSKVRGRFTSFEGTVAIGDRPEDSVVQVQIDMASVYSGDENRDNSLRSANFFDVDDYPQARFDSTHIHWDGHRGELTGELTIKEVTRPLTLQVEYLGHVQDPWGNHRIGFEAGVRIDREDWGLTIDMPVETGGLLVSREIDLEIHVELVLAS